jgi:lysophospholipase L1-like esterase
MSFLQGKGFVHGGVSGDGTGIDDPAAFRDKLGVLGRVTKFLAVGDSITDRSSGYAADYNYLSLDPSGWATALRLISAGRLIPVPRNNAFASDLEHAYSGISAAAYLTGGPGWLNGVVPINDAVAAADDADVIIVHIGTNDIDGVASAATIAASVIAVWDALVATGKPVIGTDILQRASTAAGWNSAKRDQVNAINEILQESWEAHGLMSYRPWNDFVVLDSSGYAAATEFPNDGLHPTMRLGLQFGADLWDALKAYAFASSWRIPPRGSSLWVTPNPYVDGNVSGFATSWLNNGVAAPLASKTTDADGTVWQRLETTGAENTSGIRAFYARITSGIPLAGTRVRAAARIRIPTGTGITGAFVAVQQVGSPETSDWLWPITAGGGTTTASPLKAAELVCVSEPFEVDASVTQLWIAVGIQSSAAGYVDFRQAGIFFDPE